MPYAESKLKVLWILIVSFSLKEKEQDSRWLSGTKYLVRDIWNLFIRQATAILASWDCLLGM